MWLDNEQDKAYREKLKGAHKNDATGKLMIVLTEMDQRLKSSGEDEDKACQDEIKLLNGKSKDLGEQITKKQAEIDAGALEKAEREKLVAEAKEIKGDAEKSNKANDENLKGVEKSCKEAEDQFGKRKQARLGELESITKAIAILAKDENRARFAKVLKPGFLQQASVQHHSLRVAGAADPNAAIKKGDRLNSMHSAFGKVIKAISEYKTKLDEAGKEALKSKENCESDEKDNAVEALQFSSDVDDSLSKIDGLDADVEGLQKLIKEKIDAIKQLNDDAKTAKENRDEEKKQWASGKQEITDAIAAIKLAKAALSAIQIDATKSAFLQRKQKPEAVKYGDAPELWKEATYNRKADQASSVTGLLEQIQTKLEQDTKAGDAAEKQAADAYTNFDKTNKDAVKENEDAKTKLSDEEAKKTKDRSTEKTAIEDTNKKLTAVIEKMEKVRPDCKWITLSFEGRREQRRENIDALNSATTELRKWMNQNPK
jgi:hypothetical protein